MTRETEDAQSVLRQQLELLKSCLELMRKKTGLLMRQDLVGLESSLVQEAEMMERLSELRKKHEVMGNPHREGSAECASLKVEMAAVARDIQFANQTNTRLIQNGQRFCEVLYEALFPTGTYSRSLSVTLRPVEATFQAQY